MRRPALKVLETGADDRRSYRKPTLIGGEVSTGDRSQRLTCRVLDMSATGARLELDADKELPKRIGVFLDKNGTYVECEIVWREAEQIGVRFCSAIVPGRKTELF